MSNSEWMNEAIVSKLLSEFFTNSSIIVLPHREGMTVDDNNRLVLGLRSGPVNCPTHLVHEMAHLVEIDDERMLMYGWGLQVKQVYINGRAYTDVSTTQCSEREIRVHALQYSVQRYLGINDTPRQMAKVFSWMPDFCYVEGHHQFYWRNGKNCTKLNDWNRYKYIANKIKKLSERKYTLEYFRAEWKRKNDLLWKALKQPDHYPDSNHMYGKSISL